MGYYYQLLSKLDWVMDTSKVAVVGWGTIGSGVARLLVESQTRISRHAGTRVELARVVDKDLTRPRNVTLPEKLLSNDLSTVTGDPEIVAVAQLIGGLEPARTIMLSLLELRLGKCWLNWQDWLSSSP